MQDIGGCEETAAEGPLALAPAFAIVLDVSNPEVTFAHALATHGSEREIFEFSQIRFDGQTREVSEPTEDWAFRLISALGASTLRQAAGGRAVACSLPAFPAPFRA